MARQINFKSDERLMDGTSEIQGPKRFNANYFIYHINCL